MQQTNEKSFLENAVILQKENVVRQTVLKSRQNVINDDEDEVSIIKTKKEEDDYFTLPVENNIIQAKTDDNLQQLKQISNVQNKNTINISNQDVKTTSSQEMQTPARIIADYVFLLGRLTTQAILDSEGNTIIPKNALITANIVIKAFNNGKLLELTKYSKS